LRGLVFISQHIDLQWGIKSSRVKLRKNPYQTNHDMDTISVSSILLTTKIGKTYWGAFEPQPIKVSVSVPGNLSIFSLSDSFHDAPLDYRFIYNTVLSLKTHEFPAVLGFHVTLASLLFAKNVKRGGIFVEVCRLWRGGAGTFASEFWSNEVGDLVVKLKEVRVKGEVNCVIGILDGERRKKQAVNVDIRLQNWIAGDTKEAWGEAQFWDDIFMVRYLHSVQARRRY